MSHYPIFLTLEHSRTFVAGEGSHAIAKIRLLLEAGATVSAWVSDDHEIEEIFGNNIEIIRGTFKPEYLEGFKLLYIADVEDEELKLILSAANKLNIPFNHIDDPENSTFITPAMVQRGPVIVAVSTSGKAPVLSRNIRQKIERLLPTNLGSLVDLIYNYRPAANRLIKQSTDKLKFWNKIYSDQEINKLLKLNTAQKHQRIAKLVGTSDYDGGAGHVLIVGAGPGDPELLTLKAHRALNEADVIIYDNLVSEDILNLSRRDAELIYVGKKRASHKKTQDQINHIIVNEAQKGRLVVRLKGGDPVIFGRVAEEISELRENNINYEIVAGITSAVGIAGHCSIPLTHREHASMVTFATGQLKAGKVQNWKGVAGAGRTIAVYMGISTATETATSLIRDGFSPKTPIAIVENGTRDNERRIYGTLEKMGVLISDHKIQSPALLIVGDVVSEASDYSHQEATLFQIAN